MAVALGSGGVSFVGSVHWDVGRGFLTVLAVAWEAGRQCGLSYPLSGTIALTGIGGILLLCRSCMRRSWKSGLPVSILAVLSGYWLFGCGDWSSRWYNMPDLGREYLLALDSEMYFGRSEKVRKLLAEGEYRSPFTAYYYNLLNAQQNRLPDQLMDGYQPASQGLFLPVAPHSTYLLFMQPMKSGLRWEI